MAFDPSKYVYQPRPLQNFDFGAGFRDLAEARFNRQKIDNQDAQAKAQLGEQQASRGDVNTRFAATMADSRSNTEFESKRKDYEKAVQIADLARKAAQARDFRTVEALGPSLLQMGGRFSRSGDKLNPVYEIEGPGAPRLGAANIQQTRNDVFGGGPSGSSGQTGQPFQMRSNIGPGSDPNVARNPFERLEGASAASLPPMPPAGPPGAQSPPEQPLSLTMPGMQPPVDPAADPITQSMIAGISAQLGEGGPQAPQLTPPGAPQVPPSSEAMPEEVPPPADAPLDSAGQEPANLQLTPPPNPFNPPTFSPYSIDTGLVKQENQARTQPYFEGMQRAVPGRFGDRMRAFTDGASELGYSPEDTLKLTQPQLQEMTGLWRGELAAEGQAGRLSLQQGAMEQREEDRRFANDLKLRDRAVRSADKIVQVTSLQKANDKYLVGREVEDLLTDAEINPISANALIEKLYRANNTGVFTDADYSHQREGVTSLAQAVKNGVVELFLKDHGGLNLDTIKSMKDYIGIAMQGHRRSLMQARNGLYRIWKNAKTQVEKDAIEDKIRGFFSEEFYPAEFNDGVSPGEYVGPSTDAQSPPPAGDAIGKAPVSRTLDGSPKVSPNGVPLEPGSRVPRKQPKDPKKLTDAQLEATSEDELMEMLQGAANAP